MVPHGVTLSDERMIEILGKRQADLFHHAARPRIRRYRKRDDLFEFQAFKTISQHRSSAFGCKASTPKFGTQPVADFNAWCEVRFKSRPH